MMGFNFEALSVPETGDAEGDYKMLTTHDEECRKRRNNKPETKS
jgi:hypothetical protein